MDVLSNLQDKDKDMLLKHMPWSKELPDDIKLQNKNLHGKKN
jgi:transposase